MTAPVPAGESPPPSGRLAALVEASAAAAATRARKAKIAAFADLLRSLSPAEAALAVGLLAGEPRQGRIGVGWATLAAVDAPPAAAATLTIGDLDRALSALLAETGAGSGLRRAEALDALLGRATEAEADFVRRLLVGELRHGALAGLVAEAVAAAAGVAPALVRRAAMFSGDLAHAAELALSGGEAALAAVGLQVLRPVQPMLAATADGVEAALAGAGACSVEWKLDGARIQAHKAGGEVRLFTRALNDATSRLPGVAELVAGLPAASVVLDGEVIGLAEAPEGARPRAFQETMSGFGRQRRPAPEAGLRAWFFDVLHLDGMDLIDLALRDRQVLLEQVAGPHRVPAVATQDPAEAAAFAEGALAAGHEGVVVKALESRYEAGRRGGAWRKVKPVRSFDLVVLAAEWGHGRRRGWLSNLHLGARRPGGGFVMVGKTFKGMTDELLAWQTERLLALEERREGITVYVRPELVVEVALDGVQRSTRYEGGAALRFARVKRYRPDKAAGEADTIDALLALRPA